jgi:hypothetical protein
MIINYPPEYVSISTANLDEHINWLWKRAFSILTPKGWITLSQTPRSNVLRPMESYRRKEHSYNSLFTCWKVTNMNVFFRMGLYTWHTYYLSLSGGGSRSLTWVSIFVTLTVYLLLVDDPEFLYLLHLLSILFWWRIQGFYTCYTYCLLSCGGGSRVCIFVTLTIYHLVVEDPGFLYLLHLLSIILWLRIQGFYTCYTYCILPCGWGSRVSILVTLTIYHLVVEDPGFLYLLHLLSIIFWWRIQAFWPELL